MNEWIATIPGIDSLNLQVTFEWLPGAEQEEISHSNSLNVREISIRQGLRQLSWGGNRRPHE